MDKFTRLTGVAAPFVVANVDTDRIIPARFLKTIKRTGLGRHLFNELRYGKDGAEDPDFVLNRTPYRHARITGNYEGLFRNDNGQSDPNITSLFDFPYLADPDIFAFTKDGCRHKYTFPWKSFIPSRAAGLSATVSPLRNRSSGAPRDVMVWTNAETALRMRP